MQVNVTTIILGLPEGQRVEHTSLTLPAATITVRELLAHKAGALENAADQRPEPNGQSPVQGTADTEQVAPQRQYMVVIDDQRIIDPDTVITLRPDIRIEFIKILPLVGG